jgi:hypothetical protein
VSAGAKLDILSSERRDLAITEARLHSDEQDRSVAPADPCLWVWSCNKGSSFLFREKLNRPVLVTFGRDDKDALTMHCKCWFSEGHVTKKSLQGRETVISCPGTVVSLDFYVFKELFQERHIKLFHVKLGRLASNLICGELEQQAKGVSVAGNCL